MLSDEVSAAEFWPPECCVPAFLYAAMIAKDSAVVAPSALPGILGVRVRVDQDNPLALTIADHSCPPGIPARDAVREINRLFASLQLPLRCRRLPLAEIGFGLWEEVLDAALANGLVVGLGVDFGILMQLSTSSSAEHLLRVLSRQGAHLELVDDSGEANPARFSVTTESAFQAAMAISDGFWVIGDERDLQLPFTLPWGAG